MSIQEQSSCGVSGGSSSRPSSAKRLRPGDTGRYKLSSPPHLLSHPSSEEAVQQNPPSTSLDSPISDSLILPSLLTPTGPSGPTETASSGNRANQSVSTSLMTGGTTIMNCGKVTVNVSGSYAGCDSHTDLLSVVSGQVNPPALSLETYETSCEVYRRHMSLRKKGRHPLWIPQPCLQLSLDYRRRGTQIGDVGIITEDGAFDFMFNICGATNGSTDAPSLPVGCGPIDPPVIADKEVLVLAEHSAGDALTSRDISRQTMTSGGLVFTCTRPSGAILVLPDGSVTQRIVNFTRFQQYYAQNAESWYRFARESRGSQVENGDLHLVYGCEKAVEWGIISFDNPHRTTGLAELRFRNMGEDWRSSYGTPHAWEHTNDAESKVGPRDREIQELGGSQDEPLRNQTVFIQTINTTLRAEEWRRITTAASMDVPDIQPPHPTSPGSAAPPRSSSDGDADAVSDPQCDSTSSQPSQILAAYLLRRYPEAKAASIASDVWSHVTDDDLESPHALVAAVLAVYSPVIHAYGLASFVSNDDRNPTIDPLDAEGQTTLLHPFHQGSHADTLHEASSSETLADPVFGRDAGSRHTVAYLRRNGRRTLSYRRASHTLGKKSKGEQQSDRVADLPPRSPNRSSKFAYLKQRRAFREV